MIDPDTGWFEMAQIPNKTAAEIADITGKTWFTRYPLPKQIVFDRGTKFMAEFAKLCHNEYGLKRKPTTTRNPQSNAIIKRIHQTIGKIIRKFDVSNIVNNDPWSGILAATMFAVRATYHITLQASLMQLVFGRDAILNIKHGMLPTGNTFGNAKNCGSITITCEKTCDGIITNTRLTTKF